MLSTSPPTRISIPFARDGSRRTIPNTSQIGVVSGAASFPDGFPPVTFIPKENGGIPPAGVDFNGVLYMLTDILRYQVSGGVYKYDADQSTAIGGYPKGAFLLKADASGMWRSTVENNTANPDTGGAGWIDVDTWLQSGTGAVRQSIQKTLQEQTLCPRQFGALAQTGVDDTAAFNACITYARINRRSISISDGTYSVRNILFGTQSTTAQSTAPLGFAGKSRSGVTIKALAGTTGTVFQAWSCAGVRFANMTIEVNNTAAMAADWEWKPGLGPSTQNTIDNVRVEATVGSTAPTLVSLRNLNDTYPRGLVVNATTANQVCIDARMPGGLLVMSECIWNMGYIRVGCQNGELRGCWGHGIELSAGAVNNLSIPSGYIYANTNRGSNIWSESFAAFQSCHSITVGPGTQIITSAVNSAAGVFDINLYAAMTLQGCEFIPPAGATGVINMWGPNCRRDSFQNASVYFNSGSFADANVTMNEPSAFDVSYDAFITKTTGRAYRNSTKNYYFSDGNNTTSFGANTWFDLVPEGLMVEGTYVLNFKWNHNGAGAPYLVNATATITVTGITENVVGNGADIIGVIGEFRPSALTQVKFRTSATGSTKSPKIQFLCNVALPLPGYVNWNLTKIG